MKHGQNIVEPSTVHGRNQKSSLRLLPRSTARPLAQKELVHGVKESSPGFKATVESLKILNEEFSIIIECWVVKTQDK